MKLKKIIAGISALSICLASSMALLPYRPIKTYAADAKIEAAIAWAVAIANDDSHGYSQTNRQGPDYDCSSLVINALKHGGINTGGASYTGNMRAELTKHGFTWIEWSSIGGVHNLQRGDILLKRTSSSGHTEIYLGNNQNVGAHSNRGYPQSGDQTGTEIDVCAYYYGNWNGVLRYNYTGPDPEPIETQPGCFTACGSWYTSIVEALKSVGAESSMEYRKKIAAANGISGYSGTADQNIDMLNKLKAGTLKIPSNSEDNNVPEPPPQIDYDNNYYPACNSSYTSIVDALKSIGVDSSMSNRKKIAEINGISGYVGTAEQNTQLLSLLKQGKLKNPDATISTPDTSEKYYSACASSHTSLVDALKSIGEDSSYGHRKEIAIANGISDYSGTASQNTQLLNMLKSGTLIRVGYVEPPAIVNYTVNLDSTGGTSPIVSMSVSSNSTYNGLPAANREGYSFNGWYTEANGGTQVTDGAGLVTASDHTLYAHWTANIYTISFESNDGSGIIDSKNISYGSSYGDMKIPEREGYTFDGWYTDISGGNNITANTIYSIADNLTLYAHWKANTYTVSFDSNGGTGTADNKTVTFDGIYSELPSLQRDGYIFNGWADSNGNIINSETIVTITSNQTLTAQWIKNKPEKLKLDKNEITLKSGEQHSIIANQNNLTYKSNNTDVAVVSKSGVVTALDEGEAIISVINEDSEVVQLKITVVNVSYLPGDCNGDGIVNIADAVALQKWLLGSGELPNWKNADFCKDNVIDSFDMVAMKRMIISAVD